MRQRCRGCTLEGHGVDLGPAVVAVAIIKMEKKESAADRRHQDKAGTFPAPPYTVTTPDDQPCCDTDETGQDGARLTAHFANKSDNNSAKKCKGPDINRTVKKAVDGWEKGTFHHESIESFFEDAKL